jgi:hypothetical protein
LALLALADRADDSGGSCWISMAVIADKASVSRSQAQRIVRWHVTQRLVSVVANQFGGKPGTTPHYQLHLDRIAALSNMGSADAAPMDSTGATGSADATRSTAAQDGPHGCTGGAAPMRQTGSTGATQDVMNTKATTRATQKSARAPLPDPAKLFPEVTQRALEDWQSVRTAKRSGAPTETAAKGFRREAIRAGLTLQQAVELCCERGWAGLNADWVRRLAGRGDTASERQALTVGLMTGAIRDPARPARQVFDGTDYTEGLHGGIVTV